MPCSYPLVLLHHVMRVCYWAQAVWVQSLGPFAPRSPSHASRRGPESRVVEGWIARLSLDLVCRHGRAHQ